MVENSCFELPASDLGAVDCWSVQNNPNWALRCNGVANLGQRCRGPVEASFISLSILPARASPLSPKAPGVRPPKRVPEIRGLESFAWLAIETCRDNRATWSPTPCVCRFPGTTESRKQNPFSYN